MKILQVGKYYPPVKGGMESVLRDLCEGLLAAGHEVNAVVADVGSEDRIERLGEHGELVRCGTVGVLASQPLTLSLLHHLRRLIVRDRPDVVQIHVPNPLGAACLLASRSCLPEGSIITVWHHADVARQRLGRHLVRPLARALLNVSDGICVSSAALRDGSTELASHRDDVAVIPFGLDPKRWSLKRTDVGEEFVFVGRLVYYKGLDLLLDAAREVPEMHLTIVGDGPLRSHLLARVANEGLRDRVHLAGEMTDEQVRRLFSQARALVLPSDHGSETFGVVQLEAMAAGLPVISTTLATGVAGVNQHEITGLQVPPGDGRALAGALRRVLDQPESCLRWGRAGRVRVKERFHRERMIASLLQWYDGLLSDRSKRNSI